MFTDKFGWYRSLAGADITDGEFRVAILLANYADGKTGTRAHPSAMKLAEESGKSDKTVRRALAALVAKGWLTKIDRPGTSAEYALSTPTLDTQMSRVEGTDPRHSDVQGQRGTLDKSDPTLDTQMSRPPGHLDVQRSDQGSDPLRIRSVSSGSDHSGQDIRDVHPGSPWDETGPEAGSLPTAGSMTEATEVANGPDSDPWGSTSEPATETRPSGLQSATGSPVAVAHGCDRNPFCSETQPCGC